MIIIKKKVMKSKKILLGLYEINFVYLLFLKNT